MIPNDQSGEEWLGSDSEDGSSDESGDSDSDSDEEEEEEDEGDAMDVE